MKRFENPPAIELEVMDLDGKVQILKAKLLSPKDLDGMLALINTLNKDNPGVIVKKQMAYIFGGKDEDYDKYSMRVLNAVLEYYNQENKNPLAGEA